MNDNEKHYIFLEKENYMSTPEYKAVVIKVIEFTVRKFLSKLTGIKDFDVYILKCSKVILDQYIQENKSPEEFFSSYDK